MDRFSSDAYFLGPKSENAAWVRAEFQAILDHWFDWRRSLFMDDPSPMTDERRLETDFLRERENMAQQLRLLRDMLCAEVPKYTPRYNGHMVSEVSLPALFGHFATLLHNPNNTSREVARVGGAMEDQAIAMLAKMVGYDPDRAQGHFTGGGTLANFEAVWRARYRMDHFLSLALYAAERNGRPLDLFRDAHMGWAAYDRLVEELNPGEDALRACSLVLGNPYEVGERLTKASGQAWRGPVLITPGNKHFSWRKAANVFGLGENSFWNAPLDADGRLDVDGLEDLCNEAEAAGRPILLLASVAGTTEAGEIDAVDKVCDLLDRMHAGGVRIWHHVDAAYGGFFCSMLGGKAETSLSPECVSALSAIRRTDSVTLDPHKLGYVPYACGAFLTCDAQRYVASSFQAPYIDRAATNDKWACTLEGSRSAAGAAATWLTGQSMGFGPDRFGDMLAGTVETRQEFEKQLTARIPEVRPVQADTNILCFSIAADGEALSTANARSARVFERFQLDPEFSISKTVLSQESYGLLIRAHAEGWGGEIDAGELVLLRCVFMNPFWQASAVQTALMPALVARIEHHIS